MVEEERNINLNEYPGKENVQALNQSPKPRTQYQKFMEKVETPVISANWATNQNSMSSLDEHILDEDYAAIKIEDGQSFIQDTVQDIIQKV